MNKKRYPLITVIGNVGSGKSTLATFLARALHAHHVAADELYKSNPFFSDAVANRSRWSLASDLWFLLERVEIAKKLDILLQEKTVVQDSGLLMSWVYANSRLNAGYMNEKEQEIYTMIFDKLTRTFPQEDLVIYLDLPITILHERIRERGRDFEIRFHTQEYLSGLAKSLKRLVVRLKQKRIPVLNYSEKNWADILQNVTHQHLLTKEVKIALS